MATAFVRIKVDRAQIRSEISIARRMIISQLGALKIPVQIIPTVNKRAAASAFGAVSMGGGKSGGGSAGVNGSFASILAGSRANRPNVQNPFTAMSGGTNREGRVDRFKSLGGFAKGSAQIGAGILGARAAMSILQAPVEMVSTAMDFERAMVRVKAVTQATDQQMKSLKETSLSLGQSTMFTATEIANSMVTLGQMGLSADEVNKASAAIVNFAAAGRITTEESASTLLGAINTMEIGMDRVSDVANILTRAAIKSPADAKKVADAFKFIGPIANLAGMNLEKVAGLLATLSKMNAPGSVIGTGGRRFLTEILKGDSEKTISKLLGRDVSIRTSAGTLKELPDIIDAINESFSGVTANEERAAFALKLFGQRGGPQFAFLLSQGGDALRANNKLMENFGVTAEGVAKKEMDTMFGATRRLAAAWEKLSIAVADSGLLDFLAKATDGLANMVSLMSQFNKLLHPLADNETFGLMMKMMFPGPSALLSSGAEDIPVVKSSDRLKSGAPEIPQLSPEFLEKKAASEAEKQRLIDMVENRPKNITNRSFDMILNAMDASRGLLPAQLMAEEERKAEELRLQQQGNLSAGAGPSFSGLEELSRQIQMSVLRPQDEQQVQKKIEENTKDSAEGLDSLNHNIENLIKMQGFA